MDPLVEERPGDALVAGRRGEGTVVAVVPPQVLREQRLDVKRWDVDLLICRRASERETRNTQMSHWDFTLSAGFKLSPSYLRV